MTFGMTFQFHLILTEQVIWWNANNLFCLSPKDKFKKFSRPSFKIC